MLRLLLKIILVASLAIFIVTWPFINRLPDQAQILSSLLDEPIQSQTDQKPFQITRNQYTYQLTPLFGYELSGLVVAQYDAQNWLDITHQHDPAQTKDICVVWGSNLASKVYQLVHYSHGEFTCFVRWDQPLNPPFNIYKLSNNHLIPVNDQVYQQIKNAQIGDQIHLTGLLVNYTITDPNGQTIGQRNTSTTRQDTGNGACEVVYTTGFTILKHANTLANTLHTLSLIILACTALLLILTFLRHTTRPLK